MLEPRDTPPSIEVWSDHTSSPYRHPQRWVNVIGRVHPAGRAGAMTYRLGDRPACRASLGPDGYRLRGPGDFNIEIATQDLVEDVNPLLLRAELWNGEVIERLVELHRPGDRPWPMPYRYNAQAAKDVPAPIVTDGRWLKTDQGLRVLEPGYDRVLAVGDSSWRDYALRARVTLHGHMIPDAHVDGGKEVVHVALCLRWTGHHDDGFQPRRRWYPLGVTCEYQLLDGPLRCRWRMLTPRRRTADPVRDRLMRFDVPYRLEAEVRSIEADQSRYRCRITPEGQPARSDWDLEHDRPTNADTHGCALLLAHYTIATFDSIEVTPL